LGSALRGDATGGNAGPKEMEDATRELEILQRSPERDQAMEYAANRHELNAAPFPHEWVIEGDPVARVKQLSSSTDGKGLTVMWDCTAGRFNWFYDIDETICVIEGSVVITNESGVARKLRAGDTYYFPKGSRAEWSIGRYVRKVAFIHVPLSDKVLRFRRILKALRRVMKPGADKDTSPTLFGG